MLVKVSTNFDLSELDMSKLTTIWLENSTRRIQSIARQNAPYDTGKLKQGIAVEKSKDQARVWPRRIPYAVRREFENYKNPQRKFYMKRTHDVAGPIVQSEFDKAFDIVSKNIQKWAI